eukprot:6033929-Prymnesium_polylepis.1
MGLSMHTRAREARASHLTSPQHDVRSSTVMLPAARRSTAASQPNIHRFEPIEPLSADGEQTQWASCPDEQRSVQRMET